MAQDQPVRRLLVGPGDGTACPIAGASGVIRRSALSGASARIRDRSGEVERIGSLERGGGPLSGVRVAGVGAHLRGTRLLRVSQRARGGCMESGPESSLLPARAYRTA